MKEQNETIIIDLSPKQQLNESFLRQFGTAIELIIKRMFGLNDMDFKIRGPRSRLDQLAKTLTSEVEYMKAFRRAGLSDPNVVSSKYKLERAIKSFESQTGIKWPLK